MACHLEAMFLLILLWLVYSFCIFKLGRQFEKDFGE